MRHATRSIVLSLFCVCVALTGSHFLRAEDADKKDEAGKKAVSLFDGKTLEGWEGDEKYFRVEDGIIKGGDLKEKIKHNYFLASKKEYKNFDLTVKFHFATDNTNSGVQFRSERLPKSTEMKGYQADLGNGYWGSLYDESRRNKVLIFMDQAEAIKLVKKGEGEWNDYRVLAEGNHIQIWLNGTKTIDYREKEETTEKGDKIAESGKLGLQIHAGNPSEVWFKDIKITELP